MKNIDFIIYVNSKENNTKVPLVFSVDGVSYACDKVSQIEGFSFGEVVEVDFDMYGFIEMVTPNSQVYNLENTKYVNYYDLQESDTRIIRAYFSSEYKDYVKENPKFLNKGITPIEYIDQTMEV